MEQRLKISHHPELAQAVLQSGHKCYSPARLQFAEGEVDDCESMEVH
ncbi:MAG TPA: hypothetical protein VJJ98_07835 [Sedimentisphaerales bacterium]|nr:hypothetical protein [Sedimentisphaerales bacterium]